MCQLALVNLGDPLLNGIFLSSLLQIDSVGNRDGTGFLYLSEDKKGLSCSLWKTKESADSIYDLGMEIRDDITTKYPVLAHVRYASKGIAATENNVHPFEGERFYLAHNGRLYGKDEAVQWTSDDSGLESDSLIFLKSLEAEAVIHPEAGIVELLNTVMGNYKGKFALLIYDRYNNKHYVIRGSSADLHMAKIGIWNEDKMEEIGFIVNTKKSSLEDAIMISAQVAQIITGRCIVSDKVQELDKETIYEVSGINLVKIGELKEDTVTYTYTTGNGYTGGYGAGGAYTRYVDRGTASLPIWKLSDRISKFMEDHFLSIPDIDALFYIFLEVSMADAELDDLEKFVTQVIPKISAPKKIRERISKILGENGTIYQHVYGKVKGLEYPWMLNDPKKLDEICKTLTELKKAMK
jgi:predicted glutamine amidotransferase